jgi:hypothetical protein
MSGFAMLDSAIPRHLIGDYMPMFPDHRQNLALIQKQDEGNIAWSLFCTNQMSPKHNEIRIPAPDDCSAANVIASADFPPEWRDTLKWVPLIGPYLNAFGLAGGYATSLEGSCGLHCYRFRERIAKQIRRKESGVKDEKGGSLNIRLEINITCCIFL